MMMIEITVVVSMDTSRRRSAGLRKTVAWKVSSSAQSQRKSAHGWWKRRHSSVMGASFASG